MKNNIDKNAGNRSFRLFAEPPAFCRLQPRRRSGRPGRSVLFIPLNRLTYIFAFTAFSAALTAVRLGFPSYRKDQRRFGIPVCIRLGAAACLLSGVSRYRWRLMPLRLAVLLCPACRGCIVRQERNSAKPAFPSRRGASSGACRLQTALSLWLAKLFPGFRGAADDISSPLRRSFPNL